MGPPIDQTQWSGVRRGPATALSWTGAPPRCQNCGRTVFRPPSLGVSFSSRLVRFVLQVRERPISAKTRRTARLAPYAHDVTMTSPAGLPRVVAPAPAPASAPVRRKRGRPRDPEAD